MHKLWKWLEYWDQTLFLRINQDSANPFFDATLPWIRQSSFWLPLYLFLAVFILYNFGWRGLIWALGFGLTIGLADNISSKALKYAFMRQRPCQDAFFAPYIRLIAGYCPGNPSFTSSHAANHFAMAAYAYSAGKAIFGKWRRWFFVWAFLICYAQVYIGIHYPLDVIGGAIVGMLLGFLVANVYNRHFSLFAEEGDLLHRAKEERR
jgi:membrane-associated phospholipid phosphatase